jgi:hypothetical protein
MIYPPRPKNIGDKTNLAQYENEYLAQAKFNGSCAIYNEGTVYNRYGKLVSWNIDLPFDGIFFGEYMNKNGLYGDCKFIIFDMLSVGSSVLGRMIYLHQLFVDHGEIDSEHQFISHRIGNVGLAKCFSDNLQQIYEQATLVDQIEGLVVKRKSSKLKPCISDSMNATWQLKIRKPSKCYSV